MGPFSINHEEIAPPRGKIDRAFLLPKKSIQKIIKKAVKITFLMVKVLRRVDPIQQTLVKVKKCSSINSPLYPSNQLKTIDMYLLSENSQFRKQIICHNPRRVSSSWDPSGGWQCKSKITNQAANSVLTPLIVIKTNAYHKLSQS